MLRLASVANPQFQREAELRQFLTQRYWLPAADYPLCGDILHALGLKGDDAQEFMTNFADAFDIDMFDFIWPKFHLGEAEAMDVRAALRPLRRFAGIRTQPMDRDLIPISIDHLAQVIERGIWFDPEPAAEAERTGVSQSITRIAARLRAGGVPKRLPR